MQVSLDRYETWSDTVVVGSGEHKNISVEMKLKALGTLLVGSNVSGADVLIDGEPKDVTRPDNHLQIQLNPGTHKVQIRKSGYQDSTRADHRDPREYRDAAGFCAARN